jgi:hypothetical protein
MVLGHPAMTVSRLPGKQASGQGPRSQWPRSNVPIAQVQPPKGRAVLVRPGAFLGSRSGAGRAAVNWRLQSGADCRVDPYTVYSEQAAAQGPLPCQRPVSRQGHTQEQSCLGLPRRPAVNTKTVARKSTRPIKIEALRRQSGVHRHSLVSNLSDLTASPWVVVIGILYSGEPGSLVGTPSDRARTVMSHLILHNSSTEACQRGLATSDPTRPGRP